MQEVEGIDLGLGRVGIVPAIDTPAAIGAGRRHIAVEAAAQGGDLHRILVVGRGTMPRTATSQMGGLAQP